MHNHDTFNERKIFISFSNPTMSVLLHYEAEKKVYILVYSKMALMDNRYDSV